MEKLNCFRGQFDFEPGRFVYQQPPAEGPKEQGEKREAPKKTPDEARREEKKAEVREKYADDKLETPDAQKKLYEDRLVKFVAALREGEAHNYGFGQIVDGFFGSEKPKGVVMVDAQEKLLTQADKDRIAQDVIKKTGLTKAEAEPLVEKAAKRAREEAKKAKEEMEKRFEKK